MKSTVSSLFSSVKHVLILYHVTSPVLVSQDTELILEDKSPTFICFSSSTLEYNKFPVFGLTGILQDYLNPPVGKSDGPTE